MNIKDFNDELRGIVEDFNNKIVELVHRAQKEDGKEVNTDEPISWAYELEYYDQYIDQILFIGSWIHDRMNGKTRYSKKSLTKKIRKVLGYTYP